MVKRLTQWQGLALAFAVCVSVSGQSVWAHPGDVNSTNDGQIVSGGMYYNTPGSKTTFTNSAGTGLYITTGTTVLGREVSNSANPMGSLTGNGGWLYFSAPGQVVRIDGNINVNALMSHGLYTGNGGTVTVDSAYLYQNGTIFANGLNGGHVQFNVGAMTLGPAGAIYAQGTTGNGGVVQIGNASSHGAMDIQQGAIVDTHGKVIGNYDTNLISIEGGLINLEGILMANGSHSTLSENGGHVVLTAQGNSTLLDSGMLSNASFISDLQANLVARDASLKQGYDGWVRLGPNAQIQANGVEGLSGDNGGTGGLITLNAHVGIENNGSIQSNGGNGGSAPDAIGPVVGYNFNVSHAPHPPDYTLQQSVGLTGGQGGNGGSVQLVYGKSVLSPGTISLLGGAGGHGGNAIATDSSAQYREAYGGNGGNGGNGGDVQVQSPQYPLLGHLLNSGGAGGTGGTAIGDTSAYPGSTGLSGASGHMPIMFSLGCISDCSSTGGPIVPAVNPSPPSVPSVSSTDTTPLSASHFNGLFQHQRTVFSDNMIPQSGIQRQNQNLVTLGQGNMFFTRTYRSLTQELLTQAQSEYARQLSSSHSAAQAVQDTRLFLQHAGIDQLTAQALVAQINAGKFQAHASIVQVLETMAQVSQP